MVKLPADYNRLVCLDCLLFQRLQLETQRIYCLLVSLISKNKCVVYAQNIRIENCVKTLPLYVVVFHADGEERAGRG